MTTDLGRTLGLGGAYFPNVCVFACLHICDNIFYRANILPIFVGCPNIFPMFSQ